MSSIDLPSTPKPSLTRFVLPIVTGAGALFGLLTGSAMDSPSPGLVIGAVVGAALAYALVSFMPSRRAGRWAAVALFAVIGLLVGGLPGIVAGAAIGGVMGWITYWLSTGDYRNTVPIYYTAPQVLWHNTYLFICGLIFFFLIAPIVTILPLSFNAEMFFTFTPKMLALDPEGYSLRHYRDFFSNPDWQQALANSVKIAPLATLLSVSFGTLAAIGLSQEHVPFRRPIMAILISPMIVPLIISAAGMYFFYSRIGLQGTYWGVVLAHAALGIPFVIITVTATLVGFDRSLTRAAANMGADPVTTFFRIQMPLILPGVISGGLFAFITSFDEVVVVLFVGSAGQKTLPWQMFTGLREQISPTILAVAAILVAISICLLTVVEMLRRRSERLRGMSPA
ncbi:polyamine ABC transporter permease [Maritimibacter sp. 55A14]|uniref:ABC transporter permease n=1 Tax=Maritimibacter sp. 55A14 TaxID=2174844 RepID=UPI000D60B120|nr:ABC transporter permease [Maritimibacter sp. 55A14]PWE30537.1 polyamine ABC transporter permease [Maritimibacter sp. 55A14]